MITNEAFIFKPIEIPDQGVSVRAHIAAVSPQVPGSTALAKIYDAAAVEIDQSTFLVDVDGQFVFYCSNTVDILIGGLGTLADNNYNGGVAEVVPKQQVGTDTGVGTGAIVQTVVTDNGDGTITIAANDWHIYDNTGGVGNVLTVPVPEDTFTPPGGGSFIIVDYNAGSPQYVLITDVELIKETDILPVVTLTKDDQGLLHQVDWDALGSAKIDKAHFHQVKTKRFSYWDGLIPSVDGALHLQLTAGRLFVGWVAHSLVAYNSADATLDTSGPTLCYEYTKNGSLVTDWASTFVQEYDNDNYNPTTGGLTALGLNKWVVLTWFRDIDDNPHCGYVRSPEQYNTFAEAAVAARRGDLPLFFGFNGVPVASLILQKGATTATVVSLIDTEDKAAVVTSHNDLAEVNPTFTPGADKPYHLLKDIAGNILVFVSGLTNWLFAAAGDFIPSTDGTQNIGGVSSRIKDIRLRRTITRVPDAGDLTQPFYTAALAPGQVVPIGVHYASDGFTIIGGFTKLWELFGPTIRISEVSGALAFASGLLTTNMASATYNNNYYTTLTENSAWTITNPIQDVPITVFVTHSGAARTLSLNGTDLALEGVAGETEAFTMLYDGSNWLVWRGGVVNVTVAG